MDQYRTIKLIVEHGAFIAGFISILPLFGAIAAFGLLSTHWLVLAAGVVASVQLA